MIPVPEPMVVPVALPDIAHVPVPVVSVRVMLDETHIPPKPMIAVGCVFTVTVAVAVPQVLVFVMVAVPAVMPVTIPVEGFMVAMVVSLLVHVPPLTDSASVVTLPAHTDVVPVIAAGPLLTVIA